MRSGELVPEVDSGRYSAGQSFPITWKDGEAAVLVFPDDHRINVRNEISSSIISSPWRTEERMNLITLGSSVGTVTIAEDSANADGIQWSGGVFFEPFLESEPATENELLWGGGVEWVPSELVLTFINLDNAMREAATTFASIAEMLRDEVLDEQLDRIRAGAVHGELMLDWHEEKVVNYGDVDLVRAGALHVG